MLQLALRLHQWALGCPLRPGSIVVDHAIIVALLVTADTTEKINNVTKNVKEEIIQAAAQQQNCTDNSELLPPRDRPGFSMMGLGPPETRLGPSMTGLGPLGPIRA